MAAKQMEPDLVRVNIRISPEVHQFFKERAMKTGVSMSSLMFLALEKSVQEQQFMGGGLQQLLKMSKELGLDGDMADVERMLSETVLDMERE